MRGELIPIATPFQGVALGWFSDIDDYLLATNDPESARLIWPFLRLHVADHILANVYPQLLTQAEIWGAPMIGGGGALGWEQYLRRRDQISILFSGMQLAPMAERLGVPFAATRQKWDEESHFRQIRMFAATVGTETRAEAVLDRRQASVKQLAEDLKAASSNRRPTVLTVGFEGASGTYFGPGFNLEKDLALTRAGIDYVSQDKKMVTNVERILKLDPDMIIVVDTINPKSHRLMPKQVVNHPLWKVMRAAKEHRVYYWRAENPLPSRWLAELAYPQILAPHLRELVRQTVNADYQYDLPETQLDRLIGQDRNRGMAGTERFEATSPQSGKLGTP